MKKKLIVIFLIFLMQYSYSQCDTVSIDKTNWSISYVNSEDPTHTASKIIDNNITTFWHTEYTPNRPEFPHEVVIDLGSSYPINAFGYIPRTTESKNGKVKEFKFYTSSDSVNWGQPEFVGTFVYTNSDDVSEKQVVFGAVDGRYVKFVGLNGLDDQHYLVASEINIYQDEGCGATGKKNQIIEFPQIQNKTSTDQPFELNATASSDLEITYSVLNGPATVSGSTLTLNGTGGIVTIKAEQLGNNSYYPSSKIQSFEVYHLPDYLPEIETRLTEDYSLQMPTLMAYPIYVTPKIEHSDLINITSVQIEVEGETHQCIKRDSMYYYLWKPNAFGNHELKITANADNGTTKTISKNITVTSTINNLNALTMNDVVIEFQGENSRWYYGKYTMPQHVNSYNKITANLTVECPNGNCDDWDRWAHIDVKGPDGNWVQIIRYMTPYGIACNHSIDLTEYESILQGDLEFRMFIDTWGTGGWQITLDFDHNAGTPDYPYSRVDEIWDAIYDFGNPTNIQPVDTIRYKFQSGIEKSKLVVSNTGHGWGENNSQNAAEFYQATNYIDINYNQTYVQSLWNNCNPNPDNCSNQFGTWKFSRAGWCPGTIAHPNIWDLTPFINFNSSVILMYRFDPTYQDFCHPNNPNCTSGITCPDCNNGYKAIYIVDGHVINYSKTPLVYGADFLGTKKNPDNTFNYDLHIYPNPTSDNIKVKLGKTDEQVRMFVYDISGKTLKTYYFQNSEQINSKIFDFSDLNKGTYFVSIETKSGYGVEKIIKN